MQAIPQKAMLPQAPRNTGQQSPLVISLHVSTTRLKSSGTAQDKPTSQEVQRESNYGIFSLNLT